MSTPAETTGQRAGAVVGVVLVAWLLALPLLAITIRVWRWAWGG